MPTSTSKAITLPRALVILGILLALGMSSAAFILGMQTRHIGASRQTVHVKGLAEKAVQADYAEWRIGLNVHGKTFAEALEKLRSERPKLDAFIKEQGFTAQEITVDNENVAPNMISEERPNGTYRSVQDGYIASQSIQLSTDQLEKLTTANKAAIEFEAAGNPISYSNPRYLLKNLEEIKMSLIAEATQNARTRAGEFIKNSNAQLGAMRSASQGAFYILRAGASIDTSDYGGSYDTTTINKTARVVVTIEYNIEN